MAYRPLREKGIRRCPSPLQHEIFFDNDSKRRCTTDSSSDGELDSFSSLSPPSSPDTGSPSLPRAKTFLETTGDLFAPFTLYEMSLSGKAPLPQPKCDAIVHSVSADLVMGRGFAVQVKKRFGSLKASPHPSGDLTRFTLDDPNCTVYPVNGELSIGSVVVQRLPEGKRLKYIIHLVTKTYARNRAYSGGPRIAPTRAGFTAAIKRLVDVLKTASLDINNIYMPDISTGLDNLPATFTRTYISAHLLPYTNVTMFLLPPSSHLAASRSASH